LNDEEEKQKRNIAERREARKKNERWKKCMMNEEQGN
jgi:hypothetical protein